MSKAQSVYLITIALVLALSSPASSRQDTGYQTIQGTRVYTVVDHDRGVATFSNDCGSQTLTQAQLQQGAIPSDIIPCPRPTESSPSTPSYNEAPPSNNGQRSRRLWGAMAAGIQEGSRNRVAVGSAIRHPDEESARRTAISKCEENGISCQIVGTFNNGCGYITTGKGDRGRVGWGSGATAQRAYDNCQARGLSCDTQTIGGCL